MAKPAGLISGPRASPPTAARNAPPARRRVRTGWSGGRPFQVRLLHQPSAQASTAPLRSELMLFSSAMSSARRLACRIVGAHQHRAKPCVSASANRPPVRAAGWRAPGHLEDRSYSDRSTSLRACRLASRSAARGAAPPRRHRGTGELERNSVISSHSRSMLPAAASSARSSAGASRADPGLFLLCQDQSDVGISHRRLVDELRPAKLSVSSGGAIEAVGGSDAQEA